MMRTKLKFLTLSWLFFMCSALVLNEVSFRISTKLIRCLFDDTLVNFICKNPRILVLTSFSNVRLNFYPQIFFMEAYFLFLK